MAPQALRAAVPAPLLNAPLGSTQLGQRRRATGAPAPSRPEARSSSRTSAALAAAATAAAAAASVRRGVHGHSCRPAGLGSRRVSTRLLALKADAVAVAPRVDAPWPDDEPVEDQGAGGGPEVPEDEYRFVIVALVAAAYVIWQMDKVNMSVAVLPMSTQYGWDAAEVGLIQSSIFWGYAATTIIGGVLSRKYGGKNVLLGAVTLWSTATLLAPFAAEISTEVFVATRVLVGLGEGLAPGAGLSMIAAWVPRGERSRSVATLGSGKTSGSILGLLLAPLVINAFGWPAMFYLFGSLGLIWAAVWAGFGKEGPEGAVSAEPAKAEEEEEAPIPWARILSTPQLWGIVTAHFCHDWGGYALLTWTPKYLNQVLGFDLQGSSQLTILPGVLAVAFAAAGSTVADSLLKDGWELTQVRKLFQGLGFVLPMACIGALAALDDVQPGSFLPVALIAGGVAFGAFSYSGLYASHADLSKKYTGIISGISTTMGALAGVGSNAFAGYVLKATDSWSLAIFLPSIVFFVIGFVTYQVLYDATPIDFDAPEEKPASA